MNSPLLDKSLDFATQIVLFYEEFSKVKKDTTIITHRRTSIAIEFFQKASFFVNNSPLYY